VIHGYSGRHAAACWCSLSSPRGRALLSVLGIALGVALGYGVYLVNGAAVDELAAAVRGLAARRTWR